MMADKRGGQRNTLSNSTSNVDGRKESTMPLQEKVRAKTKNKEHSTNFKQQFLSAAEINVGR